jgi:transposase-like protein
MRQQNSVRRQGITYSQAFKMAVVKELEDSDISFDAIRRKYGIKGNSTVQKWARVVEFSNQDTFHLGRLAKRSWGFSFGLGGAASA